MADLVRGQIAYPEPPMPATLVDGSDADDVAVYIALCAANPTCGVKAANTTPPPTTTTSPTTTSGGGGSPTAAGKQVFASAGCGGCHTLKDAGSTGNVGPNLDQLKPSAATVVAPGPGRRRRDARVQGNTEPGADRGSRRLRQLVQGSRREVATT